ncbi:MAG: universal stress protein [Thaumarchaeota archaeon]|nr:universal stress protein [Nitrososphaerota archaeon]
MKLEEIKKILVPMDGSKNSLRGLDTAIYLARQCHATITGLYVMPIYPKSLLLKPIPYEAELVKIAKTFLEKAKTRSAQNGIVFNDKIVKGHAAEVILDFAKDKKFDLIVMGARGMGSVKEIFLGSVSNAVVHKSKIRVLIVK